MAKLSRSMLKVALIACGILAAPQSAMAQTPVIRDLLVIERQLNTMCRGWSGDDPRTAEVCDVRERMIEVLSTMGYCYGRRGQAGYQMQWHKCIGDSNRP
jgi:hypothetical protein